MLTRWQTHVTGVHLLENQRQSFPSVRTFAGGRDNHERCQHCRFNDGGHDVADICLALSVNHGYLRIRTCTKKSSPRSSREKPLQRPKSCRKRLTIMLKSTLWKKPWDRKRRIRSRTDHRTTSRNPCPTSQPQRAVPAEFSHRLYDRQGPMAHPGPRRARIGITDVPGMRISAGTVTPATVVPLGTRRNGDVHPITTAVTIDVLHHHQDVPVTEVGKGIQRQGRQLLPTLVTMIQLDSRGRHGGLVLRAGIAVQQPSRQPLSCQGARPPAVPTRLVIRDHHSRRVTWFNGSSGISVYAHTQGYNHRSI